MKKITVSLLTIALLLLSSCDSTENKPSEQEKQSEFNVEDITLTTEKVALDDGELYFALTEGKEELEDQGFNTVIETSGEYVKIAIFATTDMLNFEIVPITEEFDSATETYLYKLDQESTFEIESYGDIKVGDVVLSMHDSAETVPYIAYRFTTSNNKQYAFVFYTDAIGDRETPKYEMIEISE